MRQAFGTAVVLLLLSACSPSRHFLKTLRSSELEFKDHIGFMLYDPSTHKTLADYHAGQYFTPASNTKIFTLYTSLNLLGDSLASLRYSFEGDSLIVWGTGDPSLLYGNFPNSNSMINFLSESSGKIFLSSSNFQTERLGPGWAWDDYSYYYSAERSPLPIYGNLMKVWQSGEGRWQTYPMKFMSSITQGDSAKGETTVTRELGGNRLLINAGKEKRNPTNWQIPFHYEQDLVAQLLSDTLHKEVGLCDKVLSVSAATLRSSPADSVYKVMMQDSDNFIAEQLLLMCSGILSDTLKPEIAIAYSKKHFLNDLPDELVWVDGSGLSRYNLFTPRSIVKVWEKLYAQIPRERLFSLLPAGGMSGTLKNWYKADEPFIFGKTGSLSNNHSLSGFLVTRKGRVLIFSFMNSNFIEPSGKVKGMMQDILLKIREKY